MDVVSSAARSRLTSELLYADALVFMTPSMEQLGRCVAEWRANILDKGLKVNAGKSKVMVGSSGGNIIGKWPCGVSGKEVQVKMFSAQYVYTGFTSGAVVYEVTCRW